MKIRTRKGMAISTTAAVILGAIGLAVCVIIIILAWPTIKNLLPFG